MQPKDRVATAFAHREPDRVPIDYAANREIDERFKAHFGLNPDDDEGLRRKIGVDFRKCWASLMRDDLYPVEPGTRVTTWGAPMKWIEHTAGGYWDYFGWPLQNATLDEVEAWPFPTADDFAFDHLTDDCRRWRDYFIILGGPGVGDIINQTGMLRTMEQVMVDLMTDDPAGLRLIDRRHEVELEILERAIRAADGMADMVMIGEDLGSQRGPLISMDLFRKHIRPRLQRYVDLAMRYDLPVIMHSDGSVDWVYPELIDMGISAVNAVQIECAGMEPASLKARFGDHLSFHGVWPTTGVLAHGTVEQAVDEVKHLMEMMKPGGGFAIAPAHQLQSNTPVENLVAAYEAIHAFGRYD
ncbi:MAG: uroporphyrinogen decarboxylase family protein [bacterium]